jgi:hypothetical protein
MRLQGTSVAAIEAQPAMKWHIEGSIHPNREASATIPTYWRGHWRKQEIMCTFWTCTDDSTIPQIERVEVHRLGGNFGVRWLTRLHRGLRRYPDPCTVLIQYVPHMYGWKAMNIAFCACLAIQRKYNTWVMFHEVTFPLRWGQPWKHALLAVVHRLMAWSIPRLVKQSFTSISSI